MNYTLWLALGLATIAGLSIPVGAALALWRVNILSDWAETETRHGIMAFGAGALLAAVALVLLPEGTERLSPASALFWFSAGGVGFAWLDQWIDKRRGKAAMLLAMMMDYIPEALALGAVIADDLPAAVLVAGLICLQNLPEGFNAMREIKQGMPKPPIWLFVVMVPLGPLAAFIGLTAPESFEPVTGAVMMLAAGGIVYLMFEDIAPQVPLENTKLPPLGAVLGFAFGLAGQLVL